MEPYDEPSPKQQLGAPQAAGSRAGSRAPQRHPSGVTQPNCRDQQSRSCPPPRLSQSPSPRHSAPGRRAIWEARCRLLPLLLAPQAALTAAIRRAALQRSERPLSAVHPYPPTGPGVTADGCPPACPPAPPYRAERLRAAPAP